MTDIQALVEDINEIVRREADYGKVADYIPELAEVDWNQFGLSICLADGRIYSAGEAAIPFSIQSVSKVFMLALALGRQGDSLWARVGREPSGDAFDSIILLEHEKGHPRNPFINAGALVVTDAVLGNSAPGEALGELLRFIRTAADDDEIHINHSVAASEVETGYRNVAMANYIKSHGNLMNPVDKVTGTYFHQCAVDMTCNQLARAGLFLVNCPGRPALISEERTRRINALMMTCGHYDGSGDFAFRVGIPGKSGVGGGILVIAPKKASIAVWSPGLNEYGNSKLGTLAMELLAAKTGWSIFG